MEYLSISSFGGLWEGVPYCPAPDEGLEPSTTSLKGWRSTDWANRAVNSLRQHDLFRSLQVVNTYVVTPPIYILGLRIYICGRQMPTFFEKF
jgi:hypothetical protein